MSQGVKKLTVLFLVLLVSFDLCVQNVYSKKLQRLDLSLSEVIRCRDVSFMPDEFQDKEKLRKYKNDSLIKNYQENPAVYSSAVEYGLALIDLNEIDEAQKVFKQAEKDFVIDKSVKVFKGWTDACKGDYKSARDNFYLVAKELFDGVMKGSPPVVLFPKDINSVFGLALIKDKLSEEEQKDVEQIVEKLLSFVKRDPKISCVLIVDDLREGNISQAEERIEQVVTRYPNEGLPLTLSGIAKALKGEHEKAIEQFEKAEKLNQFSPLVHFSKAKSLFELRKYEEAIQEIDKAIALDPEWHTAQSEKTKFLATSEVKKLRKKSPVPENTN